MGIWVVPSMVTSLANSALKVLSQHSLRSFFGESFQIHFIPTSDAYALLIISHHNGLKSCSLPLQILPRFYSWMLSGLSSCCLAVMQTTFRTVIPSSRLATRVIIFPSLGTPGAR